MLTRIPAKYRQAAYVGVVAALAASFALGYLAPDDVQAWVDAAARAAAIITTLLAIANIPKG